MGVDKPQVCRRFIFGGFLCAEKRCRRGLVPGGTPPQVGSLSTRNPSVPPDLAALYATQPIFFISDPFSSRVWGPQGGSGGARNGPFGGHFGAIFGPFLGHFWASFGSFLGHFWAILGTTWGHSGVVLGTFWGHFGVILGSFWGHFGVISGPIWAPN